MITLSKALTHAPIPRGVSGTSTTEPFRALAQRLRAVGESSGNVLKTVGVTSCSRGTGVSAMAANLAIGAAEVGDGPVLLVDLNVANPAQAGIFGMAGNLGLYDALSGAAPPSDCPKATSIANLSLLAPSATHGFRSPDVDFSDVRELLDAYSTEFDLVVVDLPPASEANGCLATASSLSGVLFVVEAEHTRCEAATRALRRLAYARAKVLGVILNKRKEHIPHWLYKRL
ncbi:MAG TPA: CpsD/CapB family tyrosine-protein kinase [Pirellulales bacterium]|jgi:Mrp family chromosome partitioning ATPase